MRVLVQPARRSGRTVEQHFLDSVACPVVFSDHVDLLECSTLSARSGAVVEQLHDVGDPSWIEWSCGASAKARLLRMILV
jgi:hypothetical protein